MSAHGGASCSRCGLLYRGFGPWNAILENGIAVEYLCPKCQSPQENAEAEVHEATLDYGRSAFGLAVARPRGGVL